jgi:protein-S-isoprenylcysteine O-methyltransferase Ste14
MTADQLAKMRIRLGQVGGILFVYLAQPRLRLLFLAGFLLALAGEALRLWAAGTIKKNKELATDGPYALVRHPLYLGSFLIAAGFTLASFNPYRPFRTAGVWALALGGFAWVYRRKMADEEVKIAGLFGADYERYRAGTPMFWPDWKRRSAIRRVEFDPALAFKHKEHHTIAGLLGLAAVLWMKLIYQL